MPALDLILEHLVDHLVLLDDGQAFELGRFYFNRVH